MWLPRAAELAPGYALRTLLALLALANLRWAKADLSRSERLYDEGDAAFAQAERRRLAAADLMARADTCA